MEAIIFNRCSLCRGGESCELEQIVAEKHKIQNEETLKQALESYRKLVNAGDMYVYCMWGARGENAEKAIPGKAKFY